MISDHRAGEAGLSLIEVLVVLAITSLVTALLFSTTSDGVRGNFRLAERGLAAADQQTAEVDFRRLLRAAVAPYRQAGEPPALTTLVGSPTALVIATELAGAAACMPGRRYGLAVLRLVPDGAGGRLVCEGDEHTTEMLRWPRGTARFAYSETGGEWLDQWPRPDLRQQLAFRSRASTTPYMTISAPLVRLVLEDRTRSRLRWIERAGRPSLLGEELATASDATAGAAR